jgi:hypothetical protein
MEQRANAKTTGDPAAARQWEHEARAERERADQGETPELLELARRLQAALVPVTPRPAFASGLRAQLQARLKAARAQRAEAARPGSSRLLWMAAGVGGVLSVVGLGIVGWRTWHRHSGIIPAGAAPAALPKAQAAP